MGNSIPQTQNQPAQHQNIVKPDLKVEISAPQNVECKQIDPPEPFITNIPEQVSCPAKNQLQICGNALNKPKRQLPPLKKNRSSKKFQVLHISSKQNIAAEVMKETGQNKQIQHPNAKSNQKANAFEVCELKQIETDIESNYKETRTKKMRVSRRSSNATDLYFDHVAH